MTVDNADEDARDTELMAQIASRDESSFEELYDRHSSRLYGLCLRILGRSAEAQAVLSEVFYEIWRFAERFNPQRGSARTYLTTLTRSRAIDRLRAESIRTAKEKNFLAAQSSAEGPQPSVDPAAGLIAQESIDSVRRALGELTEAQRSVLELAYFGGLSHREIAERLQLPLGTVKTNIRTALTKLRDQIASLDSQKSMP